MIPQKSASSIQARLDRAVHLHKAGQLAEAKAIYEQIVRANPKHWEALHLLGLIHITENKPKLALALLQRSLTINPTFAESRSNYGFALQKLGRSEEAEESYRAALRLKPDYPDAHQNLGNALASMHRIDEALVHFDESIRLAPEFSIAVWNRSLVHLIRGDFAQGWKDYEARKHKGLGAAQFPVPLWRGDVDLAGKRLLVHWEQGLGDTIQFSRYIKALNARGVEVLFSPQPALAQLMQSLDAVFETVDMTDTSLVFDFYIPLLSMPLATGLLDGACINSTPYLFAEPPRMDRWREYLKSSAMKIGICWQGSTGEADAGRSFSLSEFAAISQLPGVSLISLHKGAGEVELDRLKDRVGVRSLGRDFDTGGQSFLDSAAVMMNCDLIITSDTAIAHLAGALGRPVWVALKHYPDWRWGLDQPLTPWYPTMRLFRQARRGDWAGVFVQIADALRVVLGAAD